MIKQLPSSFVPYQEVSSLDLRQVLTTYLRNWYWFLLSAGMMLVAAYTYLYYQPPTFKSQALVLISDERKGLGQENILKELELFTPKKVVENEIEVLKTFTLMSQVVRKLNLGVSYFRQTPGGQREIFSQSPVSLSVEQPTPVLFENVLTLRLLDDHTVSLDGQTYPLNTRVRTPYGRLLITVPHSVKRTTEPLYVRVEPERLVTNTLMEKLKAEASSKASSVITLTLESAVADKGEAILNELINVYNQAAVKDKNREAVNTLNFIEQRLKLISTELATAEKGVEAYKYSQGIADLSAQAQGFLHAVQENDSQLNQVHIQLETLRDLEAYLNKQPGHRGGTPATLGLNDPTLLSLVNQVTKLEAQREQLVRTTSEKNPLVQVIENQIQTTKTSMAENVATLKAMLTTTQKRYLANNARLKRVIRTIPVKERGLMDITRQQIIKNELFVYLLRKREETALSFASTVSDSRTLDAARSEPNPVKPQKPLIYLLFAGLGLLLPIGVIASSDALNNRVMTRAQVKENTQAPILGEIVRKRQPESLVVVARSQSVIAEQIRTLRSNLRLLDGHRQESQVLLFTSSISGEGKSFVSLNLGASLALVGSRTILLEMDLRKPAIRHALYFMKGLGISDYLHGHATLDEIVQAIPNYDNYFVITAGSLPPNPAELLSSPRLAQLISELRAQYDYILIDTPPIGLVTDAQIIAPFADTTLYVIRHNVTLKSYLSMINELYQNKRFNDLYLVLNAVGQKESTYYSHSYKGYGYQYAYNRKKSILSRFSF